MAISGHKTRSVFERYNIVSDGDLREAARKVAAVTGAVAVVGTSNSAGSGGGGGGSCRYCLSPTGRSFPAAGGTASLSVDPSDLSTDWTATSDQPWLRIVSGSRGRGRGTVAFVVDRNGFGVSRSGTISVGGLIGVFPRETHVVTQQPSCPARAGVRHRADRAIHALEKGKGRRFGASAEISLSQPRCKD